MMMTDDSLMEIPLQRIERALHPLQTAPSGDAWNRAEMIDLLLPESDKAADAAVLVPLIPRDGVLQVLLTRRTDALRHHAGQVSFPGGRIESADAGPAAAALREAQEEVGLALQLARPLGYLDLFDTITGFRVLPVVARVDPSFVAVPHPDEVSDVFEVPLDWLMTPENLELIEVEYRGRKRRVPEFRRPPSAPTQRIWGVTAAILYNFRQRLEQIGGETHA
jgi:8-oxo-dGTP pyrophosphatase MutT (NUDIX family)